jgi:hypothetical protein
VPGIFPRVVLAKDKAAYPSASNQNDDARGFDERNEARNESKPIRQPGPDTFRKIRL